MSQLKIHDHFFKSYMSDVNYVKNFLRRNLDPKTLSQLNLNHLKQIGTEFIGDDLRSNSVDVLYETLIAGKKAYIFLHFEHQREPEVLMPLRLLKYKIKVIDEYLKKHPDAETLPTVIQLMVYNGKRTPYPYSLDFYDLFPESTRSFNRTTFMALPKLIDVKQIRDEDYKSKLEQVMMELSLKHIDDQDLEYFVKMLGVAKISDDKLNLCYVYFLKKRKREEIDSVKQIIGETIEKTRGEKMISIADSLMMEGQEKGKAEGKAETMQLVAEKLLSNNEPLSKIADITEIATSELEKLKAKLCTRGLKK